VKKNKFKFEISFNLNTYEGEKLDKSSIKQFHEDLNKFVRGWVGEYGYFYTYSKDSDGETFPTNIKIKEIKNEKI
jgi:hypothetical protein